ncbi:MAG TPA: alpha/beta fold hydrolase [Steroidobacteraceae bacterium]|nr:alpha/beta fold hydrolase [Steroidobacteraceae bacterium]
MSERLIIFSHGQDGEPWGAKIVAMAEVARGMNYRVESVDYRGIADPAKRVEKLLAFCKPLNVAPVLVGSSMGGDVATAVSQSVDARGLFLLAPAFYMPGYEQYTPKPVASPITIVHGWRDDVVPINNSIRYAREYRATLHAIDSDHRMTANIRDIVRYLKIFLDDVGDQS